MKIFFIVFVSLFSYLNYLIGRYYISAFSLIGVPALMLWILNALATTVMLSAPYVYRMYPKKEPGFLYNALQWCGYIIFGAYSILMVLMIFNVFGLFVYDKLTKATTEHRDFLKLALAVLSLGATFVMTILGFFEARKKPKIKNVKVLIADLPNEFEGVRILQISDLHVGQTIKREFVETIVSMSNEIKPDIVVLTGDMIDGTHSQLADELSAFKEIIAPMGKFMVPGNHEYYWGFASWIKYWGDIGFSPLLNEHIIVEKKGAQLVMAGVHDYSSRNVEGGGVSSPDLALKGSPANAVKILLAHQPRSVFAAAKAGFHLQISGHTHSGQYFPYNILIYFFQPYVKGLNMHEKTWIYVNQGTGYWGPPSRFGVPPEITVIELTKLPVS